MSTPLPPEIIAQTTANIGLAFQLLDEVIADPDVNDDIPLGATVVPLPYHDPGLGLRNLALAARLATAGTAVYLRSVDAPPTLSRPRTPRFAAGWKSAGFAIRLADQFAALILDFSGEQRPTGPLFISEHVGLLVDIETVNVVGYVIPEALIAQLINRLLDASFRPPTPRPQPFELHELLAVSAGFAEDLALVAA